MTPQSQLTIPNMGANCLPLLDDWSFKCLHDAVEELFQGCGRKIPRQIFLPISNQNTPCNHSPLGTGFRGMEACIFLLDRLKDVRGDLKIVVGWFKGGWRPWVKFVRMVSNFMNPIYTECDWVSSAGVWKYWLGHNSATPASQDSILLTNISWKFCVKNVIKYPKIGLNTPPKIKISSKRGHFWKFFCIGAKLMNWGLEMR